MVDFLLEVKCGLMLKNQGYSTLYNGNPHKRSCKMHILQKVK